MYNPSMLYCGIPVAMDAVAGLTPAHNMIEI